MFKTSRIAACAATCLVFMAGASLAQSAPPPKAAAIATPALAASAGLPSATVNAATTATDRRVIEDERVRIEETRLRGQTQNITVHSKLPGVRAYEVIMPPLGKDPSQDKGAAGKRTWSLFGF